MEFIIKDEWINTNTKDLQYLQILEQNLGLLCVAFYLFVH